MILFNLFFATLATMTPTCAPGAVTNCSEPLGHGVVAVSLESNESTIYFEVKGREVIDLEFYSH